jgi:hypothetical protein
MKLLKRNRLDPNVIYTNWQSFAGHLAGVGDISFPAGTRLRGDHPAVRQWPQNFAPDGTPSNEIGQLRAEAAEEAARQNIPAEEADPPAKIVEATPIMWTALDDVDYDNGRLRRKLKKGEQVEDDDPVRLAVPSAFGRFFDEHH